MLFGESPIEPDKLVQQFVEFASKGASRGESWTEAIKKALYEIGKNQLGLYVAPDLKIGQHEFLYDFLWFSSERSNDILLAVESEGSGKPHVWEDFEKLLHVKAPLKMLAFSTTRHNSQSRRVLDGVREDYLLKFGQHVEDEKYLFVEFVDPDQCAYYYYFKVPHNGALSSVEIQISDKGRIKYCSE